MHIGHTCVIQQILLLLAWLAAYAQAALITSPENSPPWIVHSNSFAMVAFCLPAEDVKKFLPAGMNPLVNEQGCVTTSLEIYNTDHIAGIPAYKIAFIVVDVANRPSRTGTPGHFAIWGRTDTKSTLDFFTREFGFPYKLAAQLDIQPAQNAYKASIAGELQIHIEMLRDKPVEGSDVVDMLSIRSGASLVKTEVPYLTKGYFGHVVSFNITAKGDPLLHLLKNTKPDWSLVAGQQIFAYSQRSAVGP